MDFRWHKSTQSPNWSLLTRESWMKSEQLSSLATQGDDAIVINSKVPQWVKLRAVPISGSSSSSSSDGDAVKATFASASVGSTSNSVPAAAIINHAKSVTSADDDDDDDEL